jgi:signal transduction histidine kinase
MADAIERRAGALAALGEKAGTVERLVSDARDRDSDATVESVVEDLDDGDWTTRVREDALRAIVENTVENALDHHDGEGSEREDGGAWGRVSLRRAGDGRAEGGGDASDEPRFVLTVEDDGPGIPDHEVEAVESGRETALEHGSGLGLWVVEWGAAAIGAEVDYADRDPRGTRVTVSIPVVEET